MVIPEARLEVMLSFPITGETAAGYSIAPIGAILKIN